MLQYKIKFKLKLKKYNTIINNKVIKMCKVKIPQNSRDIEETAIVVGD